MKSARPARVAAPQTIPTLAPILSACPEGVSPQVPAPLPFSGWYQTPNQTVDVWLAFQHQFGQCAVLTRNLVACTEKMYLANAELAKIVESQNTLIKSREKTIKQWECTVPPVP